MSWAAVAGAAVGVVGGAINASNAKKSQPGAIEAPPTNYVNPAQYAQNLQHVNQGMTNQQNLVNNLTAQNALQNQSQVFNQLGNVASGQGPNPAQAMLANATGANTANQAALMAGQRGAGQNVGLIARQAAQQGALNQQSMAGQAAALQAQQSLAALGQQGNIAGQQANQLLQGNQMYTNSALQGQQQLLNGQNQVNQAQLQNAQQQMANNQTNAGRQANLDANVNGAIGSALQLIPGKLFGGQQGTPSAGQTYMDNASNAGGFDMSTLQPQQGETAPTMDFSQPSPVESGSNFAVAAEGGRVTQQGMQGPRSRVGQMFAKGGKVHKEVPAMVSPGERYLPPKEVKKVVEGKKDPMEAGEKIPGKPKVKGAKNSYANDTVPKTLEEGGIVLPRSVTQAKHPHWAAHAFVAKIMREQALKKGK
jgi:hypothetical protein